MLPAIKARQQLTVSNLLLINNKTTNSLIAAPRVAHYSLFPPLVYWLLSSCVSPSVHQSTQGAAYTAANRPSQPLLLSRNRKTRSGGSDHFVTIFCLFRGISFLGHDVNCKSPFHAWKYCEARIADIVMRCNAIRTKPKLVSFTSFGGFMSSERKRGWSSVDILTDIL